MGDAVTINGIEVRAIVSVLESTARHIPGILVTENRTQLDITIDDFTRCGAAKGKIAVVFGKRMRVQSVQYLGMAGYSLICEPEEQRQSIPGV